MITRLTLQPEVEVRSVTPSGGDTVVKRRGRGSPRSRKGKPSTSDLRSKMVNLPKDKKRCQNNLLGMGHQLRYHANESEGLIHPRIGYSCCHRTGYVSTKTTVAERANDTDKIRFASSNPYQPLYDLGSQMPDIQYSGVALNSDKTIQKR
jgi:hypothetical protein